MNLMGVCQFCGKKIGMFKSYHPECLAEHENRMEAERLKGEQEQQERERVLREERERNSRVSKAVYDSLCSGDAALKELGELKDIGIPPDIFSGEVMSGINQYIGDHLKDNVVVDLSLGIMGLALKEANLEVKELTALPNSNILLKSIVIKDVQEGKLKCRIGDAASRLPINFQKGEIVLWIFNDVKYYETKAKTEYVGRNTGVSVRIMKGVSVRLGASHGEPLTRDIKSLKSQGMLVVTQKHLYFHGQGASFRVPYAKIVSFTPYTDGIGIQRDLQTAKPQDFATGDSWFTNVLIQTVAAMPFS